MSDSAIPRFEWGQPVWTLVDLFNDGSFPGVPEAALLVAAGDRGEVVQVGAHLETNTNVYMVEFIGNRVVGCFEDELAASPPTAESQPQ